MAIGVHPLNYEPYPSAVPQGGPEAREQIHTDPDMFGAAIGRGLSTLGQGLDHASNEGFDVATMQAKQDDRTHGNEIHSWLSDQVTGAQEKLLTLRGKDAEMALPGFKQQIDDFRRQAREQAGNPYTAQLVDDEGRRLTDIAYSQAARHAAQQRVTWDTTTSVDAATSAGNRAAIAAGSAPPDVELNANPSVINSLGRSDDFARQAAQLKGLDGETEVQKNRGTNVKTIVEQVTKDGSPDGLTRAVNFFNAQKERVDAASRLQIQNFLAAPLSTIAGQKRADEVMGRPPVASVPRVVAEIPPNFIGAIKQTEGYDARPRWDVKQWTVGYGTRASGPDERIDPAQAEARFNGEITKAANIVDSVNPNLDPGTRAALTSLTFNTGDAWTHSGLGDRIRAGDLNGAREAFLQYNKVNGETNDAVAARRAREASWFGRGDISPAESIQPRIDRGTAMLRIMDDPELANRPQVQAAALAHINKIYEAYNFQDSQQSAAFSLKLNGSVAELRDTGQLTHPIQHEEFLNGFGPVKGGAAWQDYQKDVQLGSDMRSLASQSPEEIATTYAKYANPTPGDDYGIQVQRRDSLTKAIEENQKARDKDPAGFVIRRTDSGLASWKQFNELVGDKNASPGMKTAYAQMFASKMLAEQQRLGVPAESRTVAPDWYTSPIKDQIAAAATSDDPKTRQAVIPLINAQKELWGSSYWPKIVPQIAPPGAAPLVKAIAAGADPVAMQRLLDIPKGENPAAILKEQNEVTAKNLNTAINVSFAPFLGSMVGAQKDRDFGGYADLGRKLGALYVRDGMEPSEAATKAFNDLVGNRYDFRDTWRVPKDPSISADDVQRGTVEARDMMLNGAPRESTSSENFTRNKQFVKPGAVAYETPLDVQQDAAFRKWVTDNKVPFDPNSKAPQDYDMRGFWKGLQDGDAHAKSAVDQNDGKLHYPDYWKTPYHETFSNESKWANEKAPHWTDDDKLVTPAGQVLFDDRAQNSNPFQNVQLQVNDLGVSDNDADSRHNYYRDGVFVTSPRNDGLNIAYKNTFITDTRTGRPILLTWDQLQKMGGSKEAKAAEVKDHSGDVVLRKIAKADELPDIIGKEAAQKLTEQKSEEIKLLPPVHREYLTIEQTEHQYIVTNVDGRKVDIGKGTVGSEAEAKEYAERYLNNSAKEINQRRELEGRRVGTHRTLSGLDLHVGGEGMKGFYDKILPATVGKLVKKFGARVEPGTIETPRESAHYEGSEPTNTQIAQVAEATSARPTDQRFVSPVTGERQMFQINRAAVDSAMRDVRQAMNGGASFAAAMAKHGNHDLAEIFGGKLASRASTETDTVHAVDITPELRKAAIEQGFPLFQGGEANPRGRITLADNRAVIDLFKGADKSTFLHETGHLWLDELLRDASRTDASEQLRGDRGAVLSWLGVKDASEIGTGQHEQWAEGFEHYLATSEAPSNALAKAFEAFKQWLLDVYHAVTGLRQEVSPEIRGVMDRLIATDKEIVTRRTDLADEASAVTKNVGPKTPRGRAAADPKTWSLFEYLASKGGLKPDPELHAIFGNKRGPMIGGFGPLLRHAGMTLDDALRSAKDGHYMFDAGDVTGNEAHLTPRDLLDLLDQENRKHKVYRNDFLGPDKGVDLEEEAKHIRDALHTEIEAATGESGVHIDPELEARVVEIVQKGGIHDVMEAYDRAIMEGEEHYDATAEARAADPQDHFIPGWDVPEDAGTAPARGGATEVPGGQAGGAEPGAGGSPGEQPRAIGPGDRAAAQAKLKSTHAVVAADPRWRELADTTPDYNDPEVLAESEEAARTPEPASVDPKKSLSALEKAAQDAEEVWRQLEPTLTEDERKAVNDAFANLQVDKDTKDRMIADGVACLMGAIG